MPITGKALVVIRAVPAVLSAVSEAIAISVLVPMRT